ncbi:terminase small subunit [Huintestinicola butyrica]|nr:terminase small subunit [Huintestinicola butyrica]MCU6729081.1 terminase small subunit [Huintestinicola butyrica]
MAEKKLTPKQERFCEEYLIDLNATQAAIRAGYSSKTADVQSARLLVNVKVQERISLLRSKQSKRTEVTADKVIAELAAIAFADRTELAKVDKNGSVKFTPTDSLPDDVKKIISGIKEGKFGTEVSSYDKVKALELLGKHLGLWEKAASESNAASEVPTLYKALEADDE